MKILNLVVLITLVSCVGSLFYTSYLCIQMEWVDNMSRPDIMGLLFKEHPVLLVYNLIGPLFLSAIGAKK